jgi:hypothetical protein
MSKIKHHPIASTAAALALVAMISVVAFAVYLASAAGDLPWQTDPTRIPVTPFSDIPGFTPPTPLPTATKAP